MTTFLLDLKIVFKRGGIQFILLLLILFFCTMHTSSVYFNAVALVLIFFLSLGKNNFDRLALLLLTFSIFYVLLLFISGQNSSTFTNLTVLIGPTSTYLLGKQLVLKYQYNNRLLIIVLLLMVFSFTSLMFYNIVKDVISNGIISVSRLIEDSDNKGLSATLYGLTASVAFGGLGIFYLIPKHWKSPTAWGYLILFTLSVLTTIHLVNRTGLVVIALTFFVALYITSRLSIKKIVIFIILLAILGIVLLHFNIIDDNIVEAYKLRSEVDQAVYANGNAMFGGRGWRWLKSLEYLFTQPFGWSTNQYIHMGYVHNLWLDIARCCGLLPCIIFIVATIRILYIFYKLVKTKISDLFVGVLLIMFISISAAAFVEPTIEGNPYILYFYTCLWGMAVKYKVHFIKVTKRQ